MPGFYMNNLPGQRLLASPSNPQKYILSLPLPATTRLPLFAAEVDTGTFGTAPPL